MISTSSTDCPRPGPVIHKPGLSKITAMSASRRFRWWLLSGWASVIFTANSADLLFVKIAPKTKKGCQLKTKKNSEYATFVTLSLKTLGSKWTSKSWLLSRLRRWQRPRNCSNGCESKSWSCRRKSRMKLLCTNRRWTCCSKRSTKRSSTRTSFKTNWHRWRLRFRLQETSDLIHLLIPNVLNWYMSYVTVCKLFALC